MKCLIQLAQMLNERIVEELLILYPEFELFTDNASSGKRYELSHQKALQIELVPGSASIALSYGYSEPAEAKAIFKELRLYGQTIQRFTHYTTCMIRQLDTEINLDTDLNLMVSTYLQVEKWIHTSCSINRNHQPLIGCYLPVSRA